MHTCNLGIYLVVVAEGILLLANNMYPNLDLEDSLQMTFLRSSISGYPRIASAVAKEGGQPNPFIWQGR